ncbi:MAG: hypothetical protein EZS28_034642 [Streblomastix strix]|uniref:Uncharacterized protein n=1 Tax=Streblomastix strix TaxID=222440 RepID=A0A5J4UIH1_9EUKA|nr:MAG: hypothetical protein EZS28_034642 [Streblomastix strix]
MIFSGYVRHPYLIFRFLFPQADYPIWPQSVQVRSDINKNYSIFVDFETKLEIESSDILLDAQTGEVIYDYYNMEGSQRKTYINLDNVVLDSITVNLTKRATYYAGHLDKFKQYCLDQQLFRSVHWQPKDVIILVNGYCEGSCAMFAKLIHQKKTVALGNFGGVHNKARYDVGTAGGSGPMNNQYIEQLQEKYLENLDLFIDYDINLDMFPKQFYRKGSFMQISYIELYGVTPEKADQLNEFYIYDADFHINHAEQYGNLVLEDEDKDYQMYNRVINELNKMLGNAIQDEQIAQSQINVDSDFVDNETGCVAGEVLINTNGVIEECKSLQDSDIHSVYGYKCSVENYNQRNEINDEILVGQFIKNSNGCKFSHCTAGYMRVGNKCEKEMILFGDTEDYVRPQYLEPVVDTQVDTDTDIEPKKESQMKLILIIIFAAIIVILIVSLITVSVYCSLRKVRVPQQRDNFELQQQIVHEQQDNNNIDEQPQQEIMDTDEHKTPDMDMKEPQVKQLDETQKSPDIGQTINEDVDEKEQDGD